MDLLASQEQRRSRLAVLLRDQEGQAIVMKGIAWFRELLEDRQAMRQKRCTYIAGQLSKVYDGWAQDVLIVLASRIDRKIAQLQRWLAFLQFLVGILFGKGS